MLKDLIRKPYYYVPACPCCKSMSTGYYVKEDSVDPTFTVREGLKNGELVLASKEIPYENAFCLECGFSWHYPLKLKFLTLKQIEEQKQLRNTSAFYNSMDFKKKSFLAKIF